GRLPRNRLAIAAARRAGPAENAKKIELHVRVWIDVSLHQPRYRAGDGDPDLFIELAQERIEGGLTSLDFSAGKFPVAGIGRSGQALSEQHLAVSANQNRRRDAHDAGINCAAHRLRATRLPA